MLQDCLNRNRKGVVFNGWRQQDIFWLKNEYGWL